MNSVKVLITGAGAPGIKGTIYALKNNFDNRKIEIVGTDMKDNVIGKYLCDYFFVIPKALDTNNYLNVLFDICEREKVTIIVPQNTMELSILSENKEKFRKIGVSILVSNKEAIDVANNKFQIMKMCKVIGLPIGQFYKVNNLNDLIDSAKKLGWPHEKIVVKPPISNGLRGVRIIDENINLKELFYNEKPTSLFVKMENLKKILSEKFPELVVMEYLPGDEYTVDVLRVNNNITVIPRKRDLIRSGITFNGTTENNKKLIEYSKLLSEKIGLEYCFGFQFKMDKNGIPKILESNPRIQGTMVLATFSGANIIYGAVKALLGEEVPEFKIIWKTKILRYWGGISIYDNKILSSL